MDDGDCAVCGRDVHEGSSSVRDYYELTHAYYELDPQGMIEFNSPETVTTLKFCSAKCLCAHVAAKILPDAQGEDRT